jgi:hypothetical protein
MFPLRRVAQPPGFDHLHAQVLRELDRAVVLYVPLTTQRRDSPYEVPLPRLPFLDRDSVAMFKGWDLCQACVSNGRLAGYPLR